MMNATCQPNQPLRMHLIWEVLEGAKDVRDAEVLVLVACFIEKRPPIG